MLAGRTRGYTRHPQLDRFRGEPRLLTLYLREIAAEGQHPRAEDQWNTYALRNDMPDLLKPDPVWREAAPCCYERMRCTLFPCPPS